MKKWLPILIIIVVIAAVAAWLIDHNSSQTPSAGNITNMPMTSQTSNSTAKATDKVTIQNFAFSPAHITVKKGTTVTWTNQDSTAHTVTETDGQTGPKSGDLAQGQSYTFTFTTVGTYKYACSIHASMTGEVTVTD